MIIGDDDVEYIFSIIMIVYVYVMNNDYTKCNDTTKIILRNNAD
jgi:hypothetical protein